MLSLCSFFFFSSRRRHTRCALVTGVQTCALPISYAADIHASAVHLLNLIDNILDLAKAEAGKLRIVPETVDPGVLVDDVLRLVRPEAERRSVSLSVHGSKSALRCFADPQALGQILLHLLTNAVKFTPAGGAVALHLEEKNGGIVFRVRTEARRVG